MRHTHVGIGYMCNSMNHLCVCFHLMFAIINDKPITYKYSTILNILVYVEKIGSNLLTINIYIYILSVYDVILTTTRR